MNIKACLRISFILLVFVFTASLDAKEYVQRNHDVEIRVLLLDVEEINTVSQSFTANLSVVMRWRDESLSHEGPASISVPLDDIWYPRIQILNQQKIVSTLPSLAQIHPNGEVVQRQRFWGSFSQPLDLQSFPFDSQVLKITLANVAFDGEVVNLLPSPSSGVSKKFTMPDWKISGWDFVTTQFLIEDESTNVEGMVFSLNVKRDSGFFKYKVILPLILIVMMSWLVFWIDPTLAASQISVSVTSMLTMIAYRFALAGMMPRLTFLTSLDYFVLASTLVVFVAMIEVVYTAHLSTNGQLEKARMVDRRARWILPLIYFAMAAEILYFRIWI